MLPPAWDWFVSEAGGLENCFLALKKFEYNVKAQIVSVLFQFGRNNIFELFSIQLRNYIPDSINYFTTMNQLLPSFCEIRSFKLELINGGVLDFWLEFGLRESDFDNKRPADVRLSGINFLCDI